jgi:molecular chaperone HscB
MNAGATKQNPFSVFGIEPRFDVNLAELEKTHRDLSRAVHPDRAATASAKSDSIERAMQVNEAWRVIKDPVKRAEALFTLHGIATGETNEPKPAPDFLMDMLEQREALAEARAAKDAARVHALATSIQNKQERASTALAKAFAGESHAITSELPIALKYLGELRFYRRFMEEVSAIEDELAGI